MKITAIETIRLPDRPNLLLAQVHTDEGLVGLGETSRGAAAVEAQIHELAAPYLLGKDPLAIQLHSRQLTEQLPRIREQQRRDPRGLGHRHRPVGPFRPGREPADLPGAGREEPRNGSVPTTPAPATTTTRAAVARRSVAAGELAPAPEGPYDDQVAFVHRADELAQSLLSEGYTAMKIWPFDPFAERTDGSLLSAEDLKVGLEPYRKIRAGGGRSHRDHGRVPLAVEPGPGQAHRAGAGGIPPVLVRGPDQDVRRGHAQELRAARRAFRCARARRWVAPRRFATSSRRRPPTW